MCHLSMKFSDMFDQNSPCTFDKIREKPILIKIPHSLTLRAKVKVIAKIKSQCSTEQKHASPKKIWAGVQLVLVIGVTRMSARTRTSLKQYVDLHRTGGRHIHL